MKLTDFWKDDNFVINTKTVEQFNKWFGEYIKQTRYSTDEKILEEYVQKHIKSNPKPSFDDIYTFVTLINSFYSTRMGADDCYALSKILHDNHAEIWNAITEKRQDIDLVQKIIKQQQDSKRVAFSFTTKYFSILSRFVVNKDIYPIYDSVVANVLDYYFCKNSKDNKKHSVSRCNSTNKKDYAEYVEIINELKPTPCTYKHLDNYLWTIGRLLSNEIRMVIQPNEKELKEEEKDEHWHDYLQTIRKMLSKSDEQQNGADKVENKTDGNESEKANKQSNKKLNIPSWFVLDKKNENFMGAMMAKIFKDNEEFNV